jgi:ATP-dependent helicase IRC3
MERRAAEAIALGSEEDGEDDRPRPRLSARTIVDVPEPRSVTYTDYDDPFTLADQCSGAPHINKLSTFGWVGCGEDVYVLECMGKG